MTSPGARPGVLLRQGSDRLVAVDDALGEVGERDAGGGDHELDAVDRQGEVRGDETAVDVVDEKLTKVVEQIRGPKGTEVRLTIIPAGAEGSARKLVRLVRDEIKLEDAEAKASLVEWPDAQGRITRVGDHALGLQVADGVEVEIQRSAVVQVLPKGSLKSA